jgi:hypothetical protein
VTGQWRKLRDEAPNDLYCSSNVIRVVKVEKNEMGGAWSTYRGDERCLHSFGGET